MEEENLSFGQRCGRLCSLHWHGWVIFLTPLVFSPFLVMKPTLEYRCAFVMCLMATYWVTEALPLGVTSLLPIVLFPVLGILSSSEVCNCFFKDAFMLFLGGLIVALAVEYSNLHKRLALAVIIIVGCSPRRLHFAMIMVSMLASMWINNAATTAMLCPVIKAVLQELSNSNMAKLYDDTRPVDSDEPPYPSKIAHAYYLGVAFTSSFGGLGTLIGTGTNPVFKGIYDGYFHDREETNFVKWSEYTIPIMFFSTVFMYVGLQVQYMGLFRPNSPEAQEVIRANDGKELAEKVIKAKKDELGPLTSHEIQVGVLFLAMAILFVTRNPGFTKGWADIVNDKPIRSSFPVMLLTVLFFLLPANYYFMKYFICRRPAVEQRHGSLLSWKFLHDHIPWGLVILIGSGFTLSEGMKASGLAVMIGKSLKIMQVLPAPVLQFCCICLATLMTSFASNIAMCNILIPVLIEMAMVIKVHPAYLTLPTALALSFAFLFPVSTPANAIVAGYANIRTKDMFLTGLAPCVIGCVVNFILTQTWALLVFPGLGTFPDWAVPHNSTS